MADTKMKMTMVNTTKKMTIGLAAMIKVMVKRRKGMGHTKKDDSDWHQNEDDNFQYHQEDDNWFGNDDEDDD